MFVTSIKKASFLRKLAFISFKEKLRMHFSQLHLQPLKYLKQLLIYQNGFLPPNLHLLRKYCLILLQCVRDVFIQILNTTIIDQWNGFPSID